MANEINSSIGVFIDGGYYAKINEGFAGVPFPVTSIR